MMELLIRMLDGSIPYELTGLIPPPCERTPGCDGVGSSAGAAIERQWAAEADDGGPFRGSISYVLHFLRRRRIHVRFGTRIERPTGDALGEGRAR
jgi:hypothetical protein